MEFITNNYGDAGLRVAEFLFLSLSLYLSLSLSLSQPPYHTQDSQLSAGRHLHFSSLFGNENVII
jgi:hypothetical protein